METMEEGEWIPYAVCILGVFACVCSCIMARCGEYKGYLEYLPEFCLEVNIEPLYQFSSQGERCFSNCLINCIMYSLAFPCRCLMYAGFYFMLSLYRLACVWPCFCCNSISQLSERLRGQARKQNESSHSNIVRPFSELPFFLYS